MGGGSQRLRQDLSSTGTDITTGGSTEQNILAAAGAGEQASLASFLSSLLGTEGDAQRVRGIGRTVADSLMDLKLQERDLPSQADITSFLYGGTSGRDRARLEGISDRMINPGVQFAKNQLRDILGSEAGSIGVSSAGAGFGGGSVIANRLAGSSRRGADAFSSVLNNAATLRAGLPQSLAASLSAARDSHFNTLGSLAQISSGVYGTAADIGLGTADRYAGEVASQRDLRKFGARTRRTFGTRTSRSGRTWGYGEQPADSWFDKALAGASTAGGLYFLMCWASAEYFGFLTKKWWDARRWIIEGPDKELRKLYIERGRSLAARIRKDKALKEKLRPFFEWASAKGGGE